MKSSTLLWLLLLALTCAPIAAQEIYRVVDEDGNVTYTDQKPDEESDPIDLPELNVMEDEDEPPPLVEDPESERESLEFRIRSPEDGERIAPGPGGLEVGMDIALDIPEAAQIVIYLNGQPLEPVRSLDVTLDVQPPAGENQLRAELQTPGGRVLASTPEVNFTVASPGASPQPQ